MIEQGTVKSIDELLKLGLAGVVILALAFVAWRFFKALQDSQEKRIAEAREGFKTIEANTVASNRQGDLLEGLISELRNRRRG